MNPFFRWFYHWPKALKRLRWPMLLVWLGALLFDVLSPWWPNGVLCHSSALLVFFVACERPLRSALPFLLLGLTLDYTLGRTLGGMALLYSACFLGGTLAGVLLPPHWRYYAVLPVYVIGVQLLQLLQGVPFMLPMLLQSTLVHAVLSLFLFILWRYLGRSRGFLIRPSR